METLGSVKKQTTQRVGFLLMDQFTLVSLSSAIDPLRVANSLSDSELYRWCLIGARESEQVSSDGVRVKLDHTLTDDVELDLVIVVGGIDIEESVTKADLSWLRKQAQRGAQMGALCTGSYALASAGLLNGYECSAHWDCLTLLTEQFPDVDFNTHLYTIDRDRLTCTGGTVPLHMMLAMKRAPPETSSPKLRSKQYDWSKHCGAASKQASARMTQSMFWFLRPLWSDLRA